MYQDLLVHLDASEQGKRRLDAAIALAKNLEIRLSGLYVVPPPPAAPYLADAETGAGGAAQVTLQAAMLKPLEQQHQKSMERLMERVGASDQQRYSRQANAFRNTATTKEQGNNQHKR